MGWLYYIVPFAVILLFVNMCLTYRGILEAERDDFDR